MEFPADCCGQQWQVIVVKECKVLRFCFHHWKMHSLSLVADGWSICTDRTRELR